MEGRSRNREIGRLPHFSPSCQREGGVPDDLVGRNPEPGFVRDHREAGRSHDSRRCLKLGDRFPETGVVDDDGMATLELSVDEVRASLLARHAPNGDSN